MDGLLQRSDLTLRWLFPRLEKVFSNRLIATAQDGRITRRRSYGELAARARRLSSALDAAGVEPGERVATFSRNTDDHLEQMLGVAAAARVFHALNPRLSEDELRYTIDHAGDVLAFVDAELIDSFRALGPRPSLRRVVVVYPPNSELDESPAPDSYEALLAEGGDTCAWGPLDEHAAAALCYTSGTTGRPKGVLYSHRGLTLVSLAWLFADTMQVSERDVFLPVAPLFHAHAWALPFSAMFAGAPIILPGANVAPEALASLIQSEGVTIAAGVPTIWSDLLEAVRSGKVDASALAFLQRIVCGGSAVPPSMLKAYDALGVELTQVWGMTEMSPIGTVSRLRREDDGAQALDARACQGTPAPLVDLRLVSESGETLPWDGTSIGELQARGPWIADGYFDPNNPQGRADFDGFARDQDGERWLRTGDMAVISSTGRVKLVDRKKDLVKSGGEWISSIELEQLIDTFPGVHATAVVGIPDPKWGERPIAFVELTPGATIAPEEVRAFVRATLPSWRVPDAVHVVAELPRTSLGKLDKTTLKNRLAAAAAPSAAETQHAGQGG